MMKLINSLRKAFGYGCARCGSSIAKEHTHCSSACVAAEYSDLRKAKKQQSIDAMAGSMTADILNAKSAKTITTVDEHYELKER